MQRSPWLHAGIKPWCLLWLWHPSPSLVPGGCRVWCSHAGLWCFPDWGERVSSPRHGKKYWERPGFLARKINKELEWLEGKSHLGLPPGASHVVSNVGLGILVGSIPAAQVPPQPWELAKESGSPLGSAPAQGAVGSPELLHPSGSFGLCIPKDGVLPGVPLLSHPSFWGSQSLQVPDATSLFVVELQEILWQRAGPPVAGTWGEPLHHPYSHPGSWAWVGVSGAVPILGQRNAAGARCCLYPRMDPVWGIHVGLWGPECELGVLAGDGGGNWPRWELCVLAGDGVRAAQPAGKALSTGRIGKQGHKSVSGRRRFITAPVRPGGPRGLRGRMRLPRASRSLGLARFPPPRRM